MKEGKLKNTVRLLFFVSLAFGAAVRLPALAEPSYAGLAADDAASLVAQLPAKARLVWIRYIPDLLPAREALVIGTTLYKVAEREVRSAKLWIFAEDPAGWELVGETDMDARRDEQELPSDFQISLRQVEALDVDGDRLSELVIWWDSEPWQGFSLLQCSTVLHILDYDETTRTMREITEDQVVCNQYTERALLLDVDCDDIEEIIVLNELWESETCVECPKRYRIDVWTVADGSLVRDSAWNGGQALETDFQFSLLDCDFISLLRFVVACPTREP